MFRKLEITLIALTVVGTILLLGLAVAQPADGAQASVERFQPENGLSEADDGAARWSGGARQRASLTMPYFSFAQLLPRQGGR